MQGTLAMNTHFYCGGDGARLPDGGVAQTPHKTDPEDKDQR